MKYLILISALILGGCYSSGNKISGDSIGNFQKGFTTIADVRQVLGDPQTMTVNSNGESIFVYLYMDTKVKAATFIPIVGAFAGGATSDVQTLTVTFSTDGTIKDWSMSNTSTEV